MFERSKNKLKRFKENIYSYMLSPKDAFLTVIKNLIIVLKNIV